MHHFILYLVVTFIYLAVAIDFWRTNKAQNVLSVLKLHSAMIALGLLLHGWLLYHDITAVGFNFGLVNAISAIFWLTVLIYWIADLKHGLHSLQAFVLPPAALFALLPAFASKTHLLPTGEGNLYVLHICIALLAYSLFTFASLHALLMTIAERNLHNKPTPFKLPDFPPLMVMENLLFRVLAFGFALLTVTLASGMLFSEQIFGKPLQLNHKVVFSIASWVIYGWLLFGRYRYGWRGRTAIRWTLWGFILLVLAYVGSRFVSQVILGR
ncbi:MAG TPA: cytochrome c biogenesis protein CcsA [Methylophilus sp.]|nr:cytochrome c biogenesis protein CcsA [Methylophilus sp.]HQQ33834.1 cytochrome c biogenesis protein CcsA [Methylophilus sp.]